MNTDSPVTLVWLESHEERSAWGLWIIDIDGSIQESYGVSCHLERAALWLWIEIFSTHSRQIPLIIRSQQQKTLSLLKNLLQASKRNDPTDPQHGLLSKMHSLNIDPQIKWMSAIETPLEADIEIRNRTRLVLEDYQRQFPPEDLNYIIACLTDDEPTNKTNDHQQLQPTVTFAATSPSDDSSLQTKRTGEKAVEPAEEKKLKEPIRFIGYIEGVSNVYLGAWAFVLIDRESGHGLMRSEGVQLGHQSRMPVMALISLMESLKSKHQHIEIRSREGLLMTQLSLGFPTKIDTQWLHDAGLIDEDAPYISALKELSRNHHLKWSAVPEQTTLTPIEWAFELAVDSMSALNTGDKHQQERRFKVAAEDWAQMDPWLSSP